MSLKSPIQSVWSSLLCTASIGTLASLLAPDAAAACNTVNDTTTCTGATVGEQRIDDDNQTFIVDPGATLEAVGPSTVRLNGEDNVFINRGTVTRTGSGNVIGLTSTSGTITGTNEGRINYLGADLGLRAGLNGQSTTGNVTLTNTSTGIIDSNAGGIFGRATGATGDVLVDNAGQITARSTASAGLYGRTNGGDSTVQNSGSILFDAGTAAGGFAMFGRSDTGTANLINTGTVSTLSPAASALVAYTPNGSADVINTGDVTTTGDAARGIWAYSDDTGVSLSARNAGSITTNGQNASGINLEGSSTNGMLAANVANTTGATIETVAQDSDGVELAFTSAVDADVANNGAITTSGSNAHGISAVHAGGTLDIVNVGTIGAAGAGSDGIQVSASGGDITVTNSGTVSIANGEAIDIDVQTGSVDLNISSGQIEVTAASRGGRVIDVDVNTGDVSVDVAEGAMIDGGGGRGIRVGSAMGRAEVTSAGQISALDWGILAGGNTTGVRVENAGDITVTGGSGAGIIAIGNYSNAEVVNSGDITAAGDSVAGVYASTYSTGNANVVNSGDIDTTSDAGHGIHVYSYSSVPANTFRAENQLGGAVTTSGIGAHGIFVDVNDCMLAEAVNAGSITVTGADSNAIRIENPLGDIRAENSGSLRTDSRSTIAGLSTDGDITYVVNGDAEIVGNSVGRAVIFATTVNGDVDISGSGDLTVGDIGTGIVARSSQANVTIDYDGTISSGGTSIEATSGGVADVTFSGTLTSQSASSFGVYAGSPDTANVLVSGSVTAAGTGVFAIGNNGATVLNSGDVTSSGENRHGVWAYSTGATARAENTGTIAKTGNGGDALRAGTYGANSAEVVNSGDITSTGTGSDGAKIYSYSATAATAFTLTNEASGDIATSGDFSHGLYGEVNAGTVGFTNAGDVAVNGFGADGVRTDLDTGSATLTNSGTIAASGGNGAAANLTTRGGALTLSNSGSLSSADATGASLTLTNGTATVTNSGTIGGGANGSGGLAIALNGDAAANITNTGTLTAPTDALFVTSSGGSVVTVNDSGSVTGDMVFGNTVDTVTLSGTYQGDINLGALDDALTINATAMTDFAGDLIGGDGADSLTFSGSGLSVSNSISGFETVTVLDGMTTLDGADFSGVSSFDIAAGSMLSIADGGADLAVSGDVTQSGALVLSPAATLAISGGSFVAADGSTTTLAFDDSSTPQITADGDITFASGSTVALDVQTVNTIATGFSFDAAVAGGALSDASTLTDNSMLFDFEKEVSGGNTLVITVQQTVMLPDAVAGSSPNATGAAAVLQSVIDGGGAAGTALSTAFGRLADDAAVQSGVIDFLPSTSGGLERLVTDTAISVSDTLDRRGLSDGQGTVLWVDWIGGRGEGTATVSAEGFSSDHSGFFAGLDHRFGSGVTLGVALHSLEGGTQDDGARLDRQDVDATGFAVYGRGERGNWVFSGQAGFGQVDVSSARVNALLGEQLAGDTDGDQTWLKGGVDYVFDTPGWDLQGGLAYTQISTELGSYSESGGLGALTVAGRDADSQRLAATLNTSETYVSDQFSWTPHFKAGLVTDFADVAETYSASLVAGGESFDIRQTGRGDTAFIAGAGLDVTISDRFTLGAGFSGEFADKQERTLGYLSARARF